MNLTIYEVLEYRQPHAMGWPEPPPTSHGLYQTETGAQAKIDEVKSWAESLSIVPREVLP